MVVVDTVVHQRCCHKSPAITVAQRGPRVPILVHVMARPSHQNVIYNASKFHIMPPMDRSHCNPRMMSKPMTMGKDKAVDVEAL